MVITPARYAVDISHHRRDPIDYGFATRSSMWCVDLDDLPGLGRLVRFGSDDHLFDTGASASRSIRANLDDFLARHDVARPSRILMLANPRVLGYVFNPLSVFYCYDSDGRLAHTVAEVRNTYGGRHTYLLETDDLGRAETEKVFYVSPFYPVDGRYSMRLAEPGDGLTVTVTLHREGDRPFSAVMTGHRVGDRPARLLSALRTPLATRAVMFGIRRHGITLFVKGLRPHPRPVETVTPEELSEAR